MERKSKAVNSKNKGGKMNVLITGAAGFIGSHLGEALLEKGYKVTGIDDLSTGRKENISGMDSQPNFSFVEGTILDEKLMQKLIGDSSIIFHLAAAVGVKLIIEEQIKSIETNVNGTEMVLKIAALNMKKVFMSSSSEIYGKTENGLFREDSDRSLGPTTIGRWSYSCSKALDEFLCLAYYREKKLPVIIGRFFNICGPRQTGKYGMVIPRFVEQALSGKSLTVYGDGKQTRSFCHAADAVKAIIALSEKPEAVGQIFNIGSPSAITIEDLAKKIIRLTGSKSEIIYVPYEKAYEKGFEDMYHRIPDISKIRRVAGYKTQYNLDMILREVIQYFKNSILKQ